MSEIYFGKRATPTGEPVIGVVDDSNGKTRALRHRVRHSPTGMTWGYGGSGPVDLALSLLWDVLGREPDAAIVQTFKNECVARWGDEWALYGDTIKAWLVAHGVDVDAKDEGERYELTDRARQLGFKNVQDVRNGPCKTNEKFDTCSVCSYWNHRRHCTLLREKPRL